MEPVEGTAFTLHAGIVTPVSLGSVTLSGPKLEDPANVDPQVLAHPDDLADFLFTVRQCRAIASQPALADEWGAVEVYPGPEVQNDE